jgi:hypothetical protein
MADHRAEDPPPPPPRKRQRASEAEGALADAVRAYAALADAAADVADTASAPAVADTASAPDGVVHDLDAEPPAPRRPRRVTTPPPAGSDPAPISEAPRHRANENDQRLRADKPPHWG